jgi:hypothetical protein
MQETNLPRRVAIFVSGLISFGGTAIAIALRAPQVIVMGTFFAGLLPYIICIKVIEPWLESRSDKDRHGAV